MTEVKAVLRDSGLTVGEWVKPCQSDLPEIIEAVEYVKQSVNECLTQLINESGSCNEKDESGNISEEDDEEEDAEINSDSISGFIKDVTTGNEHPKGKRKSNNLNTAKRIKK